MRFERADSGDAILDFRGRRLGSATVNGRPLPAGGAKSGHCGSRPGSYVRDGTRSTWTSSPTSRPAVRASSASHDPTDGSDYLYTLLVPADANQLFPCFDQPDLKARVRLTLTGAGGMVGRSRTARSLRPTPLGDRITTRFAETRPISTYLIAFAAGPVATGASSTVERPDHHCVRPPLPRRRGRSRHPARAQPPRARLDGALLRPAVSVREVRLRARAGVSRSAAWSIPARSSTARTGSSSASGPPCPDGSAASPPFSTRRPTSGSATS